MKVEAISTKELTKDLIKVLNGAKYFISGIFQNYLVFIPANTLNILISEENIKTITKPDSSFTPTFVNNHVLPDVNFNGHCLINNNIYIPKKVISISEFQNFHLQMKVWEKMSLFLELI